MDDDFSTDGATLAHRAPGRRTRATRLAVAAGPDTGASIDLVPGGRALVGTSPVCDLRLTDPTVSRRHLAVTLEDAGLRLADLGSTNGTFVHGVLVRDLLLHQGEAVRIGDTTLRAMTGPAATPEAPGPAQFGRLVGGSMVMRRLYPLCQRLAETTVPLVIEGETGTGKEQLAEAIHEVGPRRDGPFVVLDCTAIAPNLIESELFGHEKGAFTGSAGARVGVFERAHGGTLLIDEIGDLPLELQPKLLRAVERATVVRVGGGRAIQVDVRLLAATRRDLDREVQAGRFRDDLFHRVAVTRVELPPLRDRKGDVELLAAHFAAQAGHPGGLPADVLARWSEDPWPGNVRELRNAVARYLALGELAEASRRATASQAAGDMIGQVLALNLPIADARERVVQEFERRYVEQLMQAHGGNMGRAAAAAGVARRHLQRLRSK